MSAEEKVFSIDDLRLVILSYALQDRDDLSSTCKKKLNQKRKKMYKNAKEKWEYFILKLLIKIWRIQIPLDRI
jgi:hypothetical protein